MTLRDNCLGFLSIFYFRIRDTLPLYFYDIHHHMFLLINQPESIEEKEIKGRLLLMCPEFYFYVFIREPNSYVFQDSV